MTDEPKITPDAGSSDAAPKRGLVERVGRLFDGPAAWMNTFTQYRVFSLLAAALIGVGLWMLQDVYDTYKPWAPKTDEFLQDLKQDQQKEFGDLKQALAELGEGNRGSQREVSRAVDAIEKSNTGLLQQLVLAKQENETLRRISEERTGISGGYDVILRENSGVRLDPATVLGVTDVGRGGVRVNLSSVDNDSGQNQYLSSGKSLAYRSADGRACKVSLLSLADGAVGTASFALHCA